MPDKKFDLGDYVEVKDRIAILYERFPQARIETAYDLTSEPDGKPKVIVRAEVYRKPEDAAPAGQGTSWMYLPGKTSYTLGSEVENAETSAVGRAIGMLGILIDKSFATSNEVESKSDSGPGAVVPPAAPVTPSEGETVELLGTLQKTGTVMVGSAQRYKLEWWPTPEGHAIGFRLKLDGDDRDIPQVMVTAPIGEPLYNLVGERFVARQRVTVKGKLYNVRSEGKRSFYRLVVGDHPESDFIETPDGRFPALVEAPSEPLFPPLDEDERAAVAGGLG